MPVLIRTEKTRYLGDQFQAVKGYVMRQSWAAPAAASATAILSAQSLTSGGTITTFAGQPDFARTNQYVCSGACTGSLTVNGLNYRKQVVSETVTLNGATIVHGTVAFSSITSIVLPTQSGITLNVGTDTKFGLARVLAENSVLFETVDGTQETPTIVTNTAIEKNTITFNTAPNATHNYAAAFVTTELYAGVN